MPSAVPARFVRPLVATALLAVAACTPGGDPTGPAATVNGSYALTGIAQNDGAPCGLASGSGCTLTGTGANTIVVKSGSLSLLSNGTFTMSVDGTRNGANAAVASAAGSYTETAQGLSLSVTGVPVAVPATWTTNRAQLIFALPGQSFGMTGGTALVVFTKSGS